MATKKSGQGGSAGKRKRTGRPAKAKAAGTSEARSPEAAPPAPHGASGTPRAPRTPHNSHTPHTPRTVADLEAGDHLCCLYETEEEHRAALTPYLRRGLERGEKVLYIVDSRTARTVLGYLRDDGLDPEPYVVRGQLAILTREETYLRGGVFDPAGMITLLRSETEQALAEGYAALRVTGEMTWALRGSPGSERLIEYEVLLNEFLPGSRCLAICQYDRRRFEPALLLDVLRVHPQVVIGPDVCDNPHFVPPAEFFSVGRAAAELRRWMLGLAESQRAEKALRESEERLSLVIAGTGVGAWDVNIETGAAVYNERWAEIAGYTLAELEPVSQKTWRDLVHPEDLERSDEALRRHLAGESERYECEFRMKHKDGRWVCVHDRGMVVERTDDGKPLRIAGTHSDITDRRRAEEELRRATARMELFFSQSLDGFFFRMLDEPVRWDDTTDKEKALDYVFAHQRITEVNEAMLAQYGATREQLIGLTPGDFFAHDVAHGRRVWRGLFDAGRSHHDTDERRLDGTQMWIEGDYTCMYDSEGRITGFFGAQRDVTEQRRAEEALRESEARYRTILATALDGFWTADMRGRCLEVNEAYCRMSGYSRQELLAMSVPELEAVEAPVETAARIERVARHGADRFESRHRRKDGSTFDADVSIRYQPVGGGQLAVFVRDITEQRRAENALRESEARYRTLVEAALDGIVIHVGDRVAFANRAAAAMLGLSGPAALVGQPLAGFVHPDDLASAEDRVRRVLAGEAVDYPAEARYVRRDGTELPVENTGVLVTYQGKPAILSVIRDITERKHAEEALRESEQRYRAMFEDSHAVMVLVDPDDGAIVDANPAACAYYGWSREELTRRRIDEINTLTSEEVFAEMKLARSERRTQFHFKHRRADGTIRDVEVYSGPIPLKGRTLLHSIVQDITERKRAEEALRNSLSLVEATLESTDNGILVIDREGSVVKTNRRFAEMWRIPGDVLASGKDEVLLGHVLSQLRDPDAFLAKVNALYGDPGAESADLVHFKDGRVFERTSKPMLVGGEPRARVWSFLDVTERERAEVALRESEEKFSKAFQTSPNAIAITHVDDGRFVEVNDAFTSMTGFTREDALADSSIRLRLWADEADRQRVVSALGAGLAVVGQEFQFRIRSGEVLTGLFSAQTLRLGTELCVLASIADITDRKRAEEALRESEARFRRITEGLTDYQYSVRVEDGRAVETTHSPACASVTGYTGEEFAADPYLWFRMVTPEDRDRVREHTRLTLAGEDVPAIEHRIARKDGAVRWVSDTSIPLKDPSGRLLSYDGVISDITERKLAEEALRIRDRAIATSFNAIVIADFDGSITYANDAFGRMWGYSAQEARGLNVVELGMDRGEVIQVVRDIKEKGFCVGESVGRRKDGSHFHHQFSASLVTDSAGAPIAMLSTFLDITERKQAEEELRRSEARLQSIFRVAPTGIGVVRDRVLLEVNERVCGMTGRTREELVGKSARVFYPTQEEFEYVGREKYRQIAEGGTGAVETRWMREDGSVIDVLLSSTPIDLHDLSQGITFTALDITERKRAEAALRLSENRLRSIFRVAPTGIGVIRDRILLEVNARICEMTGFSREELIGKSARVYYATQEEFEHVGQEQRRQLAERGVDVIETRWMNKGGSIVDVLLSSTPIDANDPGMGEIFTALDITERKRAEEEVRGSEERYRALFENSAVAIGMRSPDGAYLEFNGAYLEMLGYSREELLSRRTVDVTHPEDREISRSNMAAVAEDRAGSRRYEKRYLHKNGSVVWGDVCIRPLRDGDGKVVAIVGAVVDITERKEAEEALRLRSLALNAAANAVIITDREGGIEWVNLAFLALTGYREDEVIGRNPRVLTKSGAHGQAFYADLWDTILAGGVWHGELTNRRKDGRLYSEEMTITPLRDERGEINHFIAVKQDITEQKLLQAEFMQAQKMESVGRLAGGIAHDFNNLLSVINGYAELAAADRTLSTPLRAQIAAIHRAGERAATLTQQLLAFSRRQTVEPVVLDLNAAVRTIEKMLERLIGEDITLIFAPTEPLGRVRGDAGQVEQVVMNLAVNARDAMPAGGMLSIETADVELDRETAERASVQPGPYVMLAISDTGVGMDEATRDHIFEPFFTTKGSGKGTGLGLAIVYGIVRQCGGGIQVTSAVGQGTTFSIYLPRLEAAVGEEESAPPARADAVGGTEIILVVEDDESLRTMAADVLAAAGYTVLQAGHGEEALQVLARQGEPVHLVFTDMVMPGMGGLELAKEIGKTHPRIRVLFTSGFASDATEGRAAPEELTHFICKPYSVVQLVRKVREVLDWLW